MDKGTVVRTAALAVALVNQILVIAGKSPLPIDSDMVEQMFSSCFIVITSIWSWFKNNYVTKTGKKQKAVLIENDCYKGG